MKPIQKMKLSELGYLPWDSEQFIGVTYFVHEENLYIDANEAGRLSVRIQSLGKFIEELVDILNSNNSREIVKTTKKDLERSKNESQMH
jgi:hypothetical protein